MNEFEIKIYQDITQIHQSEWDALNPSHFIFQSYHWHQALVNSGSIGDDRGQWPFYICLYERGNLVGILPTFLKNNSYGEYIFDWQWANYFEMNGIKYYPKLVAYTPYTPIIGPKFLTLKDKDYSKKVATLTHGMKQLEDKLNCFSSSLLYLTEVEIKAIDDSEFQHLIPRENFQYNFINQDYESFENLLTHFKKNKRKNIKKERRNLDQHTGLIIEQIKSNQITQYAASFYQYYQSTIDKKYAFPYLTQSFFEIIFEKFQEQILLFHATLDGESIAQSLSFFNDEEIFGRYWGIKKQVPGLHFELCYYQNIEFALKNKLKRVQAGAQGQHKIPRGFLPESIYSLHHFHHKNVNDSIQNFIKEENLENLSVRKEMMALSPFKLKS